MTDLPLKPKFSALCNQCGQCCKAQLCEIAKIAFPHTSAPCPAMHFKDGKVFCGMVVIEAAAGLEPIVRNTLGIGTGCSMPDNDTTQESIIAADQAAFIRVYGRPHSGRGPSRSSRGSE